jgi:hypothetical protein
LWKFKKPSQLSLSQSLIKIKKELKKKEKNPIPKRELTLEEIALVQQIQDQTKNLNKNNVTRTKAYLEFYNRHPEIHWAFLGHMVSRNGGWNMTDLKGGLLTDLLTQKERVSFFAFLERGNWLIFQDAFPQFLIYEESMKRGQNLFYLLPYFHVSMFMETLWNQFWEEQDSYVLTVALIINEQSYLESRVLQNPSFKKEVFSKLEFKLQDLLSMNHILFPCLKNGEIQLAGQTLHHFESLHERILLGKRLYAILFSDQHILKMTEIWATSHPHSGSRKDYWPHIFNDINEGVPGKALKPRIRSCKIVPGSFRIYSPKLAFAWKNREHKQTENADWFQNWNVVKYLIDSGENIDGEIENDYCKTLERLEFAAITKKAMFLLD